MKGSPGSDVEGLCLATQRLTHNEKERNENKKSSHSEPSINLFPVGRRPKAIEIRSRPTGDKRLMVAGALWLSYFHARERAPAREARENSSSYWPQESLSGGNSLWNRGPDSDSFSGQLKEDGIFSRVGASSPSFRCPPRAREKERNKE